MNTSAFNSSNCIQPAELDFDCAIRRFAPKSKQQLEAAFQPFADSVIIGKGKMPAQASGNKRLRALVDVYLQDYSQAKFKRDKTFIVTNILHQIQDLCPVGAFVKFDGQRWWEVSDRISREKIACMFRDSLSSQYKSSNKNKVAKRRAQRALKRSKAMFLQQQEVEQETPPIIADPEQAVSSFSWPQTHIVDKPMARASIMVLEGLDLGCMIESVDRSVFDSTDFIVDEAVLISSDESSFEEFALI